MRDMFEIDRSASRGDMRLHQAYIFRHEDPLGNAHAGKLFDRVQHQLKEGVNSPRKYADYAVSTKEAIERDLPEGVTLHLLMG